MKISKLTDPSQVIGFDWRSLVAQPCEASAVASLTTINGITGQNSMEHLICGHII